MEMFATTLLANHHWHDGGWEGPPWPAFFVVPLLLGVAFVLGVLVSRSRRPPGALQLVAERYARGEIDEDEYRQRSAGLKDRR